MPGNRLNLLPSTGHSIQRALLCCGFRLPFSTTFAGTPAFRASSRGYWLVRRVEGMGLGDVKLMALIGAFIGTKLTLVTILAASIGGAVFGFSTVPVVWWKRRRRWLERGHSALIARQRAAHSARMALRYHAMPFGVFLGGAALLAVFFGERFFRWYWAQLPLQGGLQ